MGAEIAALALLGVAGSLHCLGMCGGFAVAVTASAGGARRRALERALCWSAGKATTYAVLGVLASDALRLAAAGGGVDPAFLRRAAAWGGGGALVAVGAVWIVHGALPHATFVPRALSARLAGGLGRVVRGARALPGRGGAFAAGLATGLLPCGLTWSALLFAARLEPAAAALGMAAFGLGTAPALVAAGLGWSALPDALRRRARPLGGAACLVLGLVTVARGGVPDGVPDPRPACCREEPASRREESAACEAQAHAGPEVAR